MTGRRSMAAQRGFLFERIHQGHGSSKIVRSPPGQRLAGRVRGYLGYRNEQGGSVRLRLVPSTRVSLDFNLGARPRLIDSHAAPSGAMFGMRTHPATLACVDGRGILVELSPHGAYTLLGVPLWELTNTVVDVVDVLGRSADRIMTRLAETSEWHGRLALLEDALATRSEAGPQPAPQVVWAWEQLCRSHGRVPVDRLAAQVGWTRRHLLTRFREQIGVTPKTAARMIRFQSALHLLLRSEHRPSVARLAQVTGYSDQAHLTREFRTLTGATPVELTDSWPYHDKKPHR